jgi:hypothetical protein
MFSEGNIKIWVLSAYTQMPSKAKSPISREAKLGDESGVNVIFGDAFDFHPTFI